MPPKTTPVNQLIASKYRRDLADKFQAHLWPLVTALTPGYEGTMYGLIREFPFTAELFSRFNALPLLAKLMGNDDLQRYTFPYSSQALKNLNDDPVPPDLLLPGKIKSTSLPENKLKTWLPKMITNPTRMGYFFNAELRRRASISEKKREALRRQRFRSKLKNLFEYPDELDLPHAFWEALGPGDLGQFSPITPQIIRNAIKVPTSFTVEQEARKINRYGGNTALREFIKLHHPEGWRGDSVLRYEPPEAFNATTKKLLRSLRTGFYNTLNSQDEAHLGNPFYDELSGTWAKPKFYAGDVERSNALRDSFSLDDNRLLRAIPGLFSPTLPPIPNDYRQFFPSNWRDARQRRVQQAYRVAKFEPNTLHIERFAPPLERLEDTYNGINHEIFGEPQQNHTFISTNANLRDLVRDSRNIKTRSQLEDILRRYGRSGRWGVPHFALNGNLVTGNDMRLPLLVSLNEPAYHILSTIDKLKGLWSKLKSQQAKTPTYATKERPGIVPGG